MGAQQPGTASGRAVGGGPFTIGELAAAFALTARSIRFYEDQGLLAPRREAGQRVYSLRDRGRLSLICRGKRLGFSISEIKDFLDLYEAGDGQIEQMRYLMNRARDRIAALEQQLCDVQDTLADLRGMVAAAADHLRRHGIEDTVKRASL